MVVRWAQLNQQGQSPIRVCSLSLVPMRSGMHEWGTMMDRPYLSRATRPVVGPATPIVDMSGYFDI